VGKLLFIGLAMFCAGALHAANPSAKEQAESILEASGIQGGLVVHVGCGDGKLTAALGTGESFLVHGLTTDAAGVAEARKNIRTAGLCGKVSVQQFTGKTLPYADNLVNLVVMQDAGYGMRDAGYGIRDEEIMRVLAPGGVLLKIPPETRNPKPETFRKKWPEKIDEWTHYLHGPQNNAVAEDASIGPPRSLRWACPPRWGRTHEELASMSAMVSARGRLFYIVDNAPLISVWYPAEWKLVARDAFNGVKLWEKPVARWNDHLRHFRAGPTHLPRRLVAVGDDVFVTLGLDAPVTRLDAATGRVVNTYKGTERTEEIVCHDGRLHLMVGTSESKRSGEGLSRRGEPEPTATRFLIALDVESGKELWRKNAKGTDFILPLSLAAFRDKVFYQDISGIACLDARTGARKWLAKRPTPSKRYGWSTSTLVITQDVVLCADRKVTGQAGEKVPAATTDPSWAVSCFKVPSVSWRGDNELIAYSMADGRQLWSARCGEGYNSPVDVFAIDSTVWLGPSFGQGYDLATGQVRKKFSVRPRPVGMVHARCYRNKASSNFIFTGRDGIEVIDLQKGWTGNNSWVRGTCQYGILPANGMLYAPPNACGCHPKARLQGLNALSSTLPDSANGKPVSEAGRLVQGPAYEQIGNRKSAIENPNDWPMYRHDALRSGSTGAAVSNSVKLKWTTEIGGRLTQPVYSGGKLFVASSESHQLHALWAEDGRTAWSHTAGGRIDSSPTLCRGLVIFGSADGWVTCLDGRDGQLVWRFHAAPQQHLIVNHGRLESSWPVHGSVLSHNGELVFTAGRSSYLDGGIYLYRVDPLTGKMLACSIISHLDPVSGKQTGKEVRGSFDSEGTISDILSADGESIFLKHLCFDSSGREVQNTRPHLFSPTGLLGEEWFIRAYWLFGTNTGAGYFRWANMKSGDSSNAPAGRILSFDDRRVYGYGRVQHSGGWTGHRGDAYHLFCSAKVYEQPSPPAAGRRMPKAKARTGKTFTWSQKYPLIVRSMVLTADKLIVAGLPDLARKEESGLSFSNPEEGLAALAGRRGGCLAMISTTDGTKLREIKLESPPVFDGMSATDGKVFISLKDGSVTCFTDGKG